MASEYIGAVFALDELGNWRGVHNPATRWNGWACPLFTLDVCRDIAEVLNALPDNCEVIKVTDSQVFSIYTDGDEIDMQEYEPVTIDGVNFYPLGSMGWVWDDVQEHCESCAMLDNEDRELTDGEIESATSLCGDCQAYLGGK
jgi:hypothetical protein